MQWDLFGVYFRGTRSEIHIRFSLPPSKCIYQSLTPTHTHTHTHTQRSCLQTSNPARFTFAGLGGWCQGVTSAECDLPCREHYYPREEFNTGGQPGAIFNSLLGNAEKGWSEHLKKEKVALTKKKKKQCWLSESQSAANMLPCWPHRTFPTSYSRHPFRDDSQQDSSGRRHKERASRQ